MEKHKPLQLKLKARKTPAPRGVAPREKRPGVVAPEPVFQERKTMSKENPDETESNGSKLLTDGGRNVDHRDTRWKKFGSVSVATVSLEPFIYNDLEAIVDDFDSRIQLHPSDPGEVNIEATFKGSQGENDVRLGGILQLTPDQADALAEALTDCAEAARESE